MLELREWIRSADFPDKPWLLLGKGPSFARRGEFDLSAFNLMGINGVVDEQKVDVAHIIDVDVVQRSGERLIENCEYLLMPRRPHVSFMPTERLLEDFFDELPVLRELDSRGRLVWYNARTSAPVDSSPVIRIQHFTSEASVDILGVMGAKTVRSLGIDGGQGYAKDFSGQPALANDLPSYDAQFREIEDIVADHGIDYDTLLESMHVFVGVDESQVVAARVLECSIRKHASRPVRFHMMQDIPTPTPKDPANRGRTGFSFSRFLIPKLAGYKGRALYVDADMQVFDDIAEMWEIPFGEHRVLCTRQDEPPEQWKDFAEFHPGRQMSVMMLDCERLTWDIDEIVGGMDRGEYTYQDLLFELCIAPEEHIGDDLPPRWNHLEHYEPGETGLLHYTVVPTQPWKNDENPLKELWEQGFAEAKAAYLVREHEINRLVRGGFLKRSLVGKSPENLPIKLVNRVVARGEVAMRKADTRSSLLQRPRVMRLRGRLGRL
jgi:hypothetical protein